MDIGRCEGDSSLRAGPPWYDPTWDMEDQGGFNMVVKGGKGKGKGQGECHHCGEKGHFKRECPKLLSKGGGGKGGYKGGGKGAGDEKGSGKGKGFQGDCYTSGKPGHTSRECWKGKGKGYGAAGGKGGIRACEDYWQG